MRTLALALFFSLAGTHGLAVEQWHTHDHPVLRWIQQYHPWCCGEKDCFPIPSAQLTPEGDYIFEHPVHPGITARALPKDVREPTPDGQFWACFTLKHSQDMKEYTVTNEVRCFFARQGY